MKEKVLQQETQLKLFDNTQFIYELALAQMELRALGVEFRIGANLRTIWAEIDSEKAARLIERAAYLQFVGDEPTVYSRLTKHNQTRSFNQYLTHWIYPYKGKFHPQMVRAILNIIGAQRGEIVLDPFVGSGTAAIETQLLGIDFVGFDISPLCVLQTLVKTRCWEAAEEIRKVSQQVLSVAKGQTLFTRTTNLQEHIRRLPHPLVRAFFEMAYLVATSDKARRQKDFARSFVAAVNKMVASVDDYRKVIKEVIRSEPGRVTVCLADARAMPLPNECVDYIITSPPYSIALDYVANDEHAFTTMGYSPATLRGHFIGVRGKGRTRVDLYNADMAKVYKEMARVLKHKGWAVIIIGDATLNGRPIQTVKMTKKTLQTYGFNLQTEIDKIIYGLYNVMQSERILFFRKETP